MIAPAVPVAVAVVERYVHALAATRYADAFEELDAAARAYFRTARNFAGGFTADHATLTRFRILGTRADGTARVVFVRESIALDEPAHDARVSTVVTLAYPVHADGGAVRLDDPGRPWRAYASHATATSGNLMVTVKRVAYYARSLRVVVTLENAGSDFVTVLPYGRSVLRDGDAVYRPLETRDSRLTDRGLFLGVRLAPRTRYTGALAFVTPPLGDRDRRLSLTLGPCVRDGGTAPFAVEVDDVAAPA